MRFGTLLAVALPALILVGCGIGEKVRDPCHQIREGYQSASRKASGLRSRSLAPGHPTRQLATRRLRSARQALSRCEAAQRG